MAKNNKVPKRVITPTAQKTPKKTGEPAAYKDLNIAWQIGTLDWDGDWGANTLNEQMTFHLTDELLENIGDISNKLLDRLTELDNKTFENIDNFLEKLYSNVDEPVDNEKLRLIIKAIKRNVFYNKIYPKLKAFEGKNWYEVESEMYYGREGRAKTKHHSINIEKFGNNVKKRLAYLKLNDIDELFSLRLEGKIRIYGIRKFNFLQVIWIDLKHEIYPVNN